MKNLIAMTICTLFILTGCGGNKPPKGKPNTSKPPVAQTGKVIRITHVSAQKGGQEVMMYSMGLVGIGYKFGGTNPQAGFDCSGMVGYIYKNALGVQLPRTAKDIAMASSPINKAKLKIGDLVFFNTNGNPYSHMGIYIGDNRFIHAPSTNGSIRIAEMSNKYFTQRFTGARTLFAN